MGRTLAKVHYAALLCILFIVRSTTQGRFESYDEYNDFCNRIQYWKLEALCFANASWFLSIVCPDAVANKSCRDTFTLQTNETVSFGCETNDKPEGEWWKVTHDGCTLLGPLEEKPPQHKAIFHDNFTLQLFKLTYEDTATYTCVLLGDVVASNCLRGISTFCFLIFCNIE